MSYLQIKRLVDENVKRLNAPLVMDDELRRFAEIHNISDKKIGAILLKCNLAIKRHNRSVYNKQVVHQIVQQMLKSEQEGVNEVGRRVSRMYQMMQPLTVSGINASEGSTVRAISSLANELPETRHLFALSDMEQPRTEAAEIPTADSAAMGQQDMQASEKAQVQQAQAGHAESEGAAETEKEAESAEVGNAAIGEVGKETELGKEELGNERIGQVQDAGQAPDHAENNGADADVQQDLERQVAQQVQQTLHTKQLRRDELRAQYDTLRTQLIALHHQILYNQEKSRYIKDLGHRLHLDRRRAVSGADLQAQVSRFGILVEKLDFQSHS